MLDFGLLGTSIRYKQTAVTFEIDDLPFGGLLKVQKQDEDYMFCSLETAITRKFDEQHYNRTILLVPSAAKWMNIVRGSDKR